WTLCPEVPSRSRWSTRGSSSREMLMPRTMSTISLFSASCLFFSRSLSRACCSLILALTLSISAWIFWLLLTAIDTSLSGYTPVGVEMGMPVTCIQICILDGNATVDHHSVPHIEATGGHARRVIGADKEHQIAGLWIAGRGADVIEPL